MKKKISIYDNSILSIPLKSIWNTLTEDENEDYPSSVEKFISIFSRISKSRRDSAESFYNAYVIGSKEYAGIVLVAIEKTLSDLFSLTTQLKQEVETFYRIKPYTKRNIEKLFQMNKEAWEKSVKTLKDLHVQREEEIVVTESIAVNSSNLFEHTEIIKHFENQKLLVFN